METRRHKRIQKLIDDGYHRLPSHLSKRSLSRVIAYMEKDGVPISNIVYEVHDRRKQYYEKKLKLEGIDEIEPNKVFYETHKHFDSLVYKNWDDIRNRMKKIKARLKL